MEINITSKQYKNLIINESLFDEESRNLSKKEKETVYNAGQELEESFYEYFQDLEIGAYKTQHVRSVKDLNNFSWCY